MKKKLISLCLAGVLCLTTACSTTWLSTFDGYLKVAGPILIQILDIVAAAKGVTPDSALVVKINADQAAVNAIAQSISTATGANPAGACQEFNAAVATFADDLNQIETLANVGPGTSAEILDAVGIAQAAITEVEAPIAACASAPTPALAKAYVANAALTVTSPEDVVKKFNKVVDKKHQVHLHGKAVRVLTFGYLQ